MKNFWKKVSGAVWLQVITVSCVLFIVNIAAAASLERVDSGSRQFAGAPGQTESSDSLDLDEQSFNESGAFGDWEDFSDFYEDSQSARPDSSSSSESRSESSSESSSEPSSVPSSSEPSSESTPASVPGDSPMDAPSHETTPPISSQTADESVPPAE